MLYYGSLLGAYRHFRNIPWDEDIDVLVLLEDQKKLRKIYNAYPGYTLTITHRKKKLWKFHKIYNSTERGPELLQMWPFIDIFFFSFVDNRLKVWGIKDASAPVSYNDVFPLDYRLFDTMVLPVPNNAGKCLEQTYGDLDICKTNVWDHKHGKRAKKVSKKPCRSLATIFPFVYRTRLSSGDVVEELRVGNITHMAFIRRNRT
ncbi:hypothetical protein DPMN_160622 [Dreissena polymorpha]|uniref:LicD/FKTN/FKRP nucleotidyltransferase domain-containing protein n=1 Tax=Dreissena polymorpha TaxID=45954 RepID=A0A9D4ISQ5_DREPO|nr:hypothetical protein DPMN_160622 [Dreissena polymorpha]